MESNQQLVPSEMWLTHLIVIGKRCKPETGVGLIEFIHSFKTDDEAELLKELRKYLIDRYPQSTDTKS